MSKEALEKAVRFAQKLGEVLLATADLKGTPHMSIAQPLGLDSLGRLQLLGWFCQYTSANLSLNPRVSILIWDPKEDEGYQLIGRIEDIKEVAVLDGYAPFVEKQHPMPGVERKISICVQRILRFERRPHIDVEV